ncbi:MAG TPA: hypothetical protein VMT17_10350 [Anaeromyxobacteraceae bacterium]|nr:hypothetical protein [Anaeromyxobacteraceae bacterium]
MTDRAAPTRLGSRLFPALLALAAGGCAGTRSFTIPAAIPALGASGRKVPTAVGVYFSPDVPGRVASQEVSGAEGPTKYLLPIGDAVVDTYLSLLPRLFDRVERVSTAGPPPSGSDLSGVLEVGLARVDMALPTAFETRPCRVSIEQEFTLRDRGGTVVATWKASGSGEEPRGAIVQCGGQAASSALEGAAEGFVRGFSDDPAAHAWIVSVSGKRAPIEGPSEVTRALARASETTEPEHPEVRTFGVYGGGGYFWPSPPGGHLPTAQGGIELLLGASWRPLPWLGLNLEAQNLSSSYGPAVDLNQTTFAPLARFTWPLGFAEPWVAAGPVLDFAYMSWLQTGSTTQTNQSRFLFGGQVAAGIDFIVSPSVELGARWQWLLAYADFGVTTGSAPVGGQSVAVTGGYFWP